MWKYCILKGSERHLVTWQIWPQMPTVQTHTYARTHVRSWISRLSPTCTRLVHTEGTFINLVPRLFWQKVPDQRFWLSLNCKRASLQNHIRVPLRTRVSGLEIPKASLWSSSSGPSTQRQAHPYQTHPWVLWKALCSVASQHGKGSW